jgi:hypothetical protein
MTSTASSSPAPQANVQWRDRALRAVLKVCANEFFPDKQISPLGWS